MDNLAKKTLVFIFVNIFYFIPYLLAEDQLYNPPIFWVDSYQYDFHQVLEGTNVEHNFLISNKGESALVISKIVPSCGCMAVMMDGNVINPGESKKLKVYFNTAGFLGMQTKDINLQSNDPQNDFIVLQLKGIVKPLVEVNPTVINFGQVYKDNKSLEEGLLAEQKVTLKASPNTSARIKNYFVYSKYIKVLSANFSKDRKRLDLTLGLSKDVPLGDLRSRVAITLKNTKERAINLPVYALVRDWLDIKPSLVYFGVISGKNPIVKTVRLRSLLKNKPLNIKKVISYNKAITTKLSKIKEGRVYLMHIILDPTKINRDLSSKVVIYNQDKDKKPVVLAVYGVLPPKK